MDHFTRLQRQAGAVAGLIVTISLVFAAGGIYTLYVLGLKNVPLLIGAVLVVSGVSILGGVALSRFMLQPLFVLWKAITHLSDKAQNDPPPQAEQLKIGRTLVGNLLLQLYQLASTVEPSAESEEGHRSKMIQAANIVNHMPLPLFVFNKDLLVTNASDAGLTYCGIESSQLFGKILSETIHLEFPSERTLDKWIEDCKQNRVTDTAHWERVRVVLSDASNQQTKLRRCDMAAYYNRDNPSGAEFIVTMFDRSEQYGHDDNNMSFVALAVHELRTPLTMLRGYIEVFTDELNESLDDEMKGFLQKMDISARQLNAFVDNILNVAKVDENALTLHLTKADWKQTLEEIVAELTPKALTHDIALELHVADELPPVAIDKVSVTEIITNLLDNAIKYSDNAKKIIVASKLNKEGVVETTVQDFGVGIPESVLPHIFEKFYRNHRTKAQIGGSGLGLYLSKSLVNAHGGNIWVSSKVGEGSTFGFSLQPYDHVASQQPLGEEGMTRTAHGWIKNHSIYRR